MPEAVPSGEDGSALVGMQAVYDRGIPPGLRNMRALWAVWLTFTVT
ncbi:hypothetical protein GCM10018963_03250 [Saccharothrix longispora]